MIVLQMQGKWSFHFEFADIWMVDSSVLCKKIDPPPVLSAVSPSFPSTGFINSALWCSQSVAVAHRLEGCFVIKCCHFVTCCFLLESGYVNHSKVTLVFWGCWGFVHNLAILLHFIIPSDWSSLCKDRVPLASCLLFILISSQCDLLITIKIVVCALKAWT